MIPKWVKNLLGGSGAATPGSKEYARSSLLKAAMEAFRLARRDRPREHYQPHGYSGDAAILGSHDMMHRRTRDLVRNTAQAKTIKTKLVNMVVGRGMQTFAWPFAPAELFQIVTELESIQAGELGPRLHYALESDDLFDQYFADRRQFDIEERLAGPEVYRMLLGEAVTVGNGLLVRVFRRKYDPDRHLSPVAWQLFEREQLDESQDRAASPGKNKILGGLEFDKLNRVVAYHLFLDHPHDFFGLSSASTAGVSVGTRSIRVDARRVVDLSLYDRPSSSVGRSWMDAVGQSIWDRDSYAESELRTAAVDSVFAFVAKLENAEQFGGWGFADGGDDDDSYGNREYKVGHSPVASVIGTNESLDMVRPTRPNRDAGAFMKVIDRDTASGAGINYYSLTGDYEGTNFSSARAAKLDEDLDLLPIQQWFGSVVAMPIRSTFNLLAVATGQLKSVRPDEFRRNMRTFQRFDVLANGRDLLDPFKEGEARTTRLRTGMSTYREECARRGVHWIRELIQQAIEKRVFEMFGIQPDWTKSGSESKSESSQTEASVEEDAA